MADLATLTACIHKSIHISYPNASDRAAARQKGVSPGGDASRTDC